MILAARRINRPGMPSPAGIGLHRRRSPIAPSYCLYRLSISCPTTLSPLPSARRQAAEQPCVPYRRQLYTERIKRMMQRPTQRTAERKTAYTASRPMQYFLPDCLPKIGRPASFEHRSCRLTGIRQWINHAVKGKAAASFTQSIPPPKAMAAEIVDPIEKYGRPFRARSEVLRFTPDL